MYTKESERMIKNLQLEARKEAAVSFAKTICSWNVRNVWEMAPTARTRTHLSQLFQTHDVSTWPSGARSVSMYCNTTYHLVWYHRLLVIACRKVHGISNYSIAFLIGSSACVILRHDMWTRRRRWKPRKGATNNSGQASGQKPYKSMKR